MVSQFVIKIEDSFQFHFNFNKNYLNYYKDWRFIQKQKIRNHLNSYDQFVLISNNKIKLILNRYEHLNYYKNHNLAVGKISVGYDQEPFMFIGPRLELIL